MDPEAYEALKQELATLNDKIDAAEVEFLSNQATIRTLAAERDQHMKRADTLAQQVRSLDSRALFLQEQTDILEEEAEIAKVEIKALVKAIVRGEQEINQLRAEIRKPRTR